MVIEAPVCDVSTSVLYRVVAIRGKCAGTLPEPPDPFFEQERPRGVGSVERQRAHAAELCAGCPVKRACLEFALRFEAGVADSYGIFGGTVPYDRRVILDGLQQQEGESCVRAR